MPVSSAFYAKSVACLLKKAGMGTRLNRICNRYKINKFECGKLLLKLQNHHYKTFRHSLNVAELSYQLAKKIELSEKEVFEVSLGALLHDLGKFLVNHSILDKPEPLSAEEWKVIKNHPQFGVNLLTEYEWANNILPFVLYHHERVDGLGYVGLNKEEIPLGAKIICLADSFDAMLSDRPYRRGLDLKKCLDEIEKNSGSQFEPGLAVSFISTLERLKNQVAWLS